MQVLLIEPTGFFIIIFGTGFVTLFQLECPGHFIQPHDFLFAGRRPSQQRQHIDERLREETFFAIAAVYLSVNTIFTFHWEYRKTQAVAGPFTYLSFSVRFPHVRAWFRERVDS